MKTFNAIAYLETLHTKQLLELRRSTYRLSSWTKYLANDDILKNQQHLGTLDISHGQNMNVTLDDIKKVLSTRPHIPNSKEAKMLRKERAMFNKKPRKVLAY